MNDIYSRLHETSVFHDGGFERWRQTTVGVIGCGLLGGLLAPEVVRSGADVFLCDFDRGETVNLGTQRVEPGRFKAESLKEICEAIRSGSVTAATVDVRHVGPGVLRNCGVLIDCTDDARLAYVLTELSNGLGVPLIRAAVDGTGEREVGRVLCSDSRNGGACQLCTYSPRDLLRRPERMPCPLGDDPGRPATRAGTALGMTVAGLTLLQAERIDTGNDAGLARNREVIVDWSSMAVMNAELQRSEQCVSGHQTWELTEIDGDAAMTFSAVFDHAERLLIGSEFTVECHNHPLCLGASCTCGAGQRRPGTRWATPPWCSRCDIPMQWHTEMPRSKWSRSAAAEFGLTERRLVEIGFPERGGMFVARCEGRPPLRMVVTDGPADAIGGL